MKFQTNRLEIKPITLNDKEYVLDLITNEIVGKTYMFPAFASREAAEPLFQRLVQLSEDDSRYVAGVYLDDRFIGIMNGVDIKEKQIEMGYAYLPDFYNRGYATEAFAGAISYLHDHAVILSQEYKDEYIEMNVELDEKYLYPIKAFVQ